MLNIKSSFALSVLALSLMIVGCGGGSDSNTSNNSANNSGSNSNPSTSPGLYDIIKQSDNNGFYIDTNNSNIGVKEFAILYGVDQKIAYQSKGYNGLSQDDDAGSLILTKNKLLTEQESDQVFSSQAGQFVVADQNGQYKTTFKYKIGDITGDQILSESFLIYSGMAEETFGIFDPQVQKIVDFIHLAKATKNVFAPGAQCAVITHIENNQPIIEFDIDDYDTDINLDTWVNIQKSQGQTVIIDSYAGYKVAYIASSDLESDAVIEYQGSKLHYGEYLPSSVIDVKQALEQQIKEYEDELKASKDEGEGLKESIELLKIELEAFNQSKRCMIYNKTATDQILNTLKTIPSF